MKQTIIVYSNYVEVSRKGGRLYIETPKTKCSIPLSNIDGILIFGKSYLTSEAISLCMKKQIPIILFTILFHSPVAWLPCYAVLPVSSHR